jgi:hypothetical protein
MDEFTTRISYCTQWSRLGNRPREVISEAEAMLRHTSGELYTAILGDENRPRCFLEFSGARSVCVEFLDAALRTYFHYSFQEKRPNELFISMSRRPVFRTKSILPTERRCYSSRPMGVFPLCGTKPTPVASDQKLSMKKNESST